MLIFFNVNIMIMIHCGEVVTLNFSVYLHNDLVVVVFFLIIDFLNGQITTCDLITTRTPTDYYSCSV